MPSPRSVLLILAALTLVGARGAGAQVITREAATLKDPTLFTRAPIASVTLSLQQRKGAIEGVPVVAAFQRVSLGPYSDNVVLISTAKSAIEVQGNQLANGIYSVQFSFIQVPFAGSVTIKDKTGVIATCPLQQQLNASGSQRCEATGLDVSDGKLFVTLELPASGAAEMVNVSQVTVNRHR